MDLKSVLEEVALEGLDGITLNALWLRIATRPDNNPGSLDDYVKEYVWKNLVCCRDLEFFKLPKPRPELVITSFSENVYQSRCLLNHYPVDIYSIEKVEQEGVHGYCDDYMLRISMTDEIRGEDDHVLLTVKEADEKWGQQLVIVASQALRFQVLFGTNYLPSGVGPEAYCIIERVGRSRFNGEITVPMPSGRGVLNKYLKSSNLFNIAKYMCQRGFMRKQPFNVRFAFIGKNYHVRLLHLSRFYTESGANFLKSLENICHTLKDVPNHRLQRKELLQTSGVLDEDLKKHWSIVSKFIDKEVIDYRTLHPEATADKYMSKNGKERKIVVYYLIKPFSHRSWKELEDVDEDDDDDEDEDENETEDADNETSEKQLQTGTGPLYELTYPRALQYVVDKAGPKGISVNKITRIFGLHKKTLFRVISSLHTLKTIVNVPFTSKTTNSYMLVSSKYAKEKLVNVVKAEPVQLDESMETTQHLEGDDSTIQDLPSGSKSTAKNANNDEKPDGDFIFDMDEESLDKTLAELELEWMLEKEPEPKEMDIQVYHQMAAKKKKRRELILKHLETNRVCISRYDLRKKIITWEADQGIKEEMCRKSFTRIVDELYYEGKLCHIVVHCKQHVTSQAHKLVAVNDIDISEKVVKEAILLFHTTKYKFYVSLNKTKELGYKKLKDLKQQEEGVFSYSGTLTRLSQIKDESNQSNPGQFDPVAASVLKAKVPPTKSIERLAKITKARELHTFMFYLLYDYPEEARVVKQETSTSFDPTSSQLNESTELPVYLDVQDWRRHVAPLKIHNSKYLNMPKVDGICMLGDLLMAMPICLLCRIISFDWRVDGLSDILKDPKKRLRHLYTMPAATLRDLCQKRTYIRKIMDTFNILCRMGLGSYGPNTGLRALEYTVFYLHKKAMLLDTMKSLPGHIFTNIPPPDTEFPPIHFEFKKISDLDVYWKEAHLVCMATQLGHLDPLDVPGFHGEITVAEATKPRPIDQIREDNWLPGNRRGAGGFDSSMFMHRMRNWDYKKLINKTSPRGRVQSKEKGTSHSVGRKGKKAAAASKPANTVKKAIKRARENLASKTKPPKKKKKKETIQKDAEKKKEVQKEQPEKGGKAKKLKIELDEEDKKAKMEMARLRCLFTPFENGIFLLCHVVSYLFSSKDLHFRLPSPDMRTIFRSLAPKASKDKTTFAIKGKSARLIRDENFLSHMGIYLAKTRYDLELMEEYKDFKYSHSPKHRVAMFEAFFNLLRKLHVKFSSREQTLPYDLPETTSEFHRKYDIKLSLDLKNVKEVAVPKAYFDIANPFDVRACVLWDFILGWMHSNKTICNILVYHILCKYSEKAVTKTHNFLKSCRVMYMHKKYIYKHGLRIMSRSDQMVSNLILSKRHRERLVSQYPVDLFLNGLKQMDEWDKHFEKTHLLTPSNDADDRDEDRDRSEKIQPDVTGDGQLIPLDTDKLHGGSLITLLPLMALNLLDVDIQIPDNMVRLSDEGIEQLTLKKQNRKRKAKEPALDTSLEDSNDDEEGGSTGVLDGKNRKRLRKQVRCKKLRSSGHASTSWAKTDVDNVNDDMENDGQSSLKQAHFGDVNMHFNKEGTSYGDLLMDFTMSFASGTLLALARTHMLADIDLLNTHVNVQRFFIVDPLVMKFALKECYVNDSDENPEPYSDSNYTVGKEHGVNSEKEKNTFQGSSSLSSTEMSQNMIESSAQSSSPLVSGNQIDKNPICLDKENGAKSACENKKIKNGVSALHRPDVYVKIISRLEKSFPTDYADCDVHQEFDSLSKEGSVDSGWVEQGRSLFSMIDSCGPNGATESDLEKKLEKPICTFQGLIDKLCDMSAIIRVGTMDMRFVSRQYIKEWVLETQLKAKRPYEARQEDTDDDKEPSFIFQARPWRNPMGVVNVRFLHQLLHCMLTHLIRRPGTTLQDLIDQFNPDLLPMAVLDLVQILTDLGCLRVKIFKQNKRNTIFRCSPRLPITETPWIHEGYRVLDMDVTAPLRFALFVGHLQTHPGWTESANEEMLETVQDGDDKGDGDNRIDKDDGDKDDGDNDTVEGCDKITD